jgi:hypothetical protein
MPYDDGHERQVILRQRSRARAECIALAHVGPERRPGVACVGVFLLSTTPRCNFSKSGLEEFR